MRTLKDIYYFTFYKIYQYYERGPSVWMSDWKASLTIDVLLFFLLFSGLNYYTVFFNRQYSLDSNFNTQLIILFYLLFISLPNYFLFNHKNRWRIIVKRFEQLSASKNRTGGWMVFFAVIAILVNLIFSYYLMSLINW